MAAKGALGTAFAISAAKPSTRDEAGYEALDSRTISPSALSTAANDFTIPAADHATLFTGEPITVSDNGNVTGISDDDERFVIVKGSNKIALAATRADAIAGTAINLGGTLGSAEFEVSNYKECLEATNVGEYGREYNVVRVVNLADGATRKFKGSYDNGTVQVETLFDSSDPGQSLLEIAEKSTATFAFRVSLPGGASAEDFYFEGLVTSVKRIPGGPDDAIMLRVTVEIDHRSIVEGT